MHLIKGPQSENKHMSSNMSANKMCETGNSVCVKGGGFMFHMEQEHCKKCLEIPNSASLQWPVSVCSFYQWQQCNTKGKKQTEQVFLASHQSSPCLSLLWVSPSAPQHTLSRSHAHSALDWQGTERGERGGDLGEGKGVVVRDENMGKRGREREGGAG